MMLRKNSVQAALMAVLAEFNLGSHVTIGSRESIASQRQSVTLSDLQTEYDLIMAKKSKLSRKKRDQLVAKYERLVKEGV